MKNAETAIATREDRKAALATIPSIILHELNNPLGIAMVASEWALDNVSNPEVAKEGISDTIASLQTMDKILAFASAYTKGEKLATEDFSLSNVINFIQCSGVDINLIETEGDDQIQLHTSKYGFCILILNLVKNGLEASKEHSPIKIVIDEFHGSPRLKIKDCGKGLSPTQIASYGALDSSKPDTTTIHGLGNRIIMDLISSLGIEIDIESVMGKGTCFTLTLPVR